MAPVVGVQVRVNDCPAEMDAMAGKVNAFCAVTAVTSAAAAAIIVFENSILIYFSCPTRAVK